MNSQDFLTNHIGTMTLQYAGALGQIDALERQQANILAALYQCVTSGQVDEAGTARLLEDPAFRSYYERRINAKAAPPASAAPAAKATKVARTAKGAP